MATETSPFKSAIRESAGSNMVSLIPRTTPDTPIAKVIESLQGQKFDCADAVFVTDIEGHLEGIVRINDLFAESDRSIGDIMEPEHEAVAVDDDQEHIALLAMRYNMIAVPVTDNRNRLIGAVPPEALFRILYAEHVEDLQRIAGIAPHEDGPAEALGGSLLNRYRRRLPWLVFGLFASSIITFLMAGFEESLAADVTVAFFVPALVYIAGAIGTQAVSVAVRGLSGSDVSIASLLHDELLIGMAIGSSLGLITFVSVFLILGDATLALVVGLAVLIGGTVSAGLGFGLPWLFKRFGSDPALGSGPVCTIIQDVASLFVYFLLVGILLL